jgi:hypothetical protein
VAITRVFDEESCSWFAGAVGVGPASRHALGIFLDTSCLKIFVTDMSRCGKKRDKGHN